jgi:hypothetical protein
MMAFLLPKSQGGAGHHVVKDRVHVGVLVSLFLSYKSTNIQSWYLHSDDFI